MLTIDSEPSIRGILIACAGIAATLGFFVIFLMGTLMDWRSAALKCLIIPIMTMITVCFVSGKFGFDLDGLVIN